MQRGVRVSILTLLAGLLCWAALALALDRFGLAGTDVARVEVVVVAGAGVMPGGVPGDALLARTQRAVALHQQGVGTRLAFTGGVGDWPPAEAEVSRELALAAGVDGGLIVVEARSTSTEENAAYLAEQLGPEVPIVVVTDAYHVFRVQRVFGHHFHDVRGLGVRSPWWIRTRGAFREVLAVAYYGATGRL